MKWIESFKLRARANKYKNKHDRGGIAYINSLVKQGQTVLDIGAHKAGYLYFLQKQVGKDGRVFAFEPQLELYHYLKMIKDLFKWDNVTIEHLALSDNSGQVTLYIPTNNVSKGSSPGATIVEGKEHAEFSTIQTVSTESLDAYCKRHDIKPSFLKIDVEGNELKIFQGGVNILKEYKPKILVEIEARHVGEEKALQTFQFMELLGYKGYFLYGSNQVPLAQFRFDKHQDSSDMKNYCNNFIFE